MGTPIKPRLVWIWSCSFDLREPDSNNDRWLRKDSSPKYEMEH